jgi:large repetitive protein
MKKGLISIFVTLALIFALAPLVPVFADTVGPLDHIVLSPTSVNVSAGGTQQFTALGQDSNNVTIPDLAYSWAVVAGGGSINGTGSFIAGNITGPFPNTIQVIAAQDSIIRTAYASLTIVAALGPLDHVVISPTNANLVVGGTQQFTAQAQDSNNVTIPELTYSWAVVAGGGSINGTGSFIAGNITGPFPNTVQVIAVQDSITKTAYASVAIVAALGPLDHVVISPANANIQVGGTQQFTAQGQDSNNVTIPELTYSWAVVAGGGSINGTGVFLAGNIPGPFPNTVQVIAVQDSITKTAYASVVISAAPIKKPNLPPGWSKGNKNGWENDTPPGWSHGEKNGWKDGLPPGLAKKNK